MKSYEEIADRVLERREQFEKEKKKKRKLIIGTATPICCVCLVVLLGFGVGQSDIFNKQPVQVDGNTGSNGTAGSAPKVEATGSISKAVATGVGISEEEIADYISKNSQNLLQIIEMEYSFEIETVWINKKGYYHASCDNDNKVNLDCVTLPILVNGEIYASVTLIKASEGDIIETINIGGNTWGNYNSTIFSNPETDIVFAYLPNAIGEIMIFPDNTAVNAVDGKKQKPIAMLNPDINWYEMLKTEYNTVNGKELLNPDNNVVIL